MKNLLQLIAFVFLFFISIYSLAQGDKSYIIIVTDNEGNAMPGALVSTPKGEVYKLNNTGSLFYHGEAGYKEQNGKMVETTVIPPYLIVKAPDYKDYRIELSRYSLGSIISVKMETTMITGIENGSFTFQILNSVGSPIQKARLIVLSGESHMASTEGVITYLGEEDYVKKNGVMVKTRVMPHYITAKAPGYRDRTIDLTQYALGTYIVVKLDKLDKMSTDYKSISVYVKDKNGNSISGASVSVNPGKATVTDGSGYAEALHTILLSGEYVAIEVYKIGFKIQKQYIPSGDAPRMENGRQIPAATAYFTMEKGDNDATIFHINVEVLDFDSNDPVPGASVQLNVSDGTVMNGSTDAKGEYRFSDVEYSFKGTTSKVIVKKTEYEEKWSDITSDLMTGKDNPERQFLVYIKKKVNLSGTWNCSDKGTYTITQNGNNIVWEGTSADQGKSWSHSFAGEIRDGNIVGNFKDHLPGATKNSGPLIIKIISNNRLEKISGSNFGGSIWTK